MTRGTSFHKPAALHGYSMKAYTFGCIQERQKPQKRNITHALAFLAPGNQNTGTKLVTMVTDRCENSL